MPKNRIPLISINLLKSAWQAMQQESLKKLEKKNLSDEALNRIFNELEQKANSPMGVALTQVLLSLNRENTELNLRNFREMLPNICLAGMNFLLSGVTETARDLSSLNLYGVDFRGAVLQEVMFQKSNLRYAKLDNAILRDTNLQDANLEGAKLRLARLDRANLQDADISFANLINCQFKWKQLEKSKKMNSMKINIYDFSQVIYPDWEKVNNPKWEELTDHERENALQQFRQETKALIFGADGKIIDPPFENQTSIEIYSSKID